MPPNVVVDGEGAVTAILDRQRCTSNLAPYCELALVLHDLSIDGKQAYLARNGAVLTWACYTSRVRSLRSESVL